MRFHCTASIDHPSFVLPGLLRVADQIAEIMKELPLFVVVFSPELDPTRHSATLALRRPDCAGPMVTHEGEIAGCDDFLRLKLNAPLSIGRRKRASVGIAQTCESIGRVPGV